ncbi:MAG: MaoC family dehydratase N-terminal domain-containing protein [Microbacterium sp.]
MTEPFRFPVEFGHVLAFRRAVGYDDGTALEGALDELVPPPTFVTAGGHFDPMSRVRPRPGRPWAGDRAAGTSAASDANSRMMHAEQHYEFHKPFRPGQVLSARITDGETWTKDGRSGTMTFTEILTEYRDEVGDVVVTGRAVRVKLPSKAAS